MRVIEGGAGSADKQELKALLKRLRGERADLVATARRHNKALSPLRRKIKKALADGPRTVPALAAAMEASTDDVLWHVMAMRAYGQVAEDEQEGDYFSYRLVPVEGKGR
jgi:pyruvate/2-oxoglutarate dehydrogenase complex dihydrolipoamide acyltransferase (E2) component